MHVLLSSLRPIQTPLTVFRRFRRPCSRRPNMCGQRSFAFCAADHCETSRNLPLTGLGALCEFVPRGSIARTLNIFIIDRAHVPTTRSSATKVSSARPRTTDSLTRLGCCARQRNLRDSQGHGPNAMAAYIVLLKKSLYSDLDSKHEPSHERQLQSRSLDSANRWQSCLLHPSQSSCRPEREVQVSCEIRA